MLNLSNRSRVRTTRPTLLTSVKLTVLAVLTIGVLSVPCTAQAQGSSTQASCYGADYGTKGTGWWIFDERDIDTTKSPKFFIEMLAASGFAPDSMLNKTAQEALNRLPQDRMFYFDGHGNWDVISFREPSNGPKSFLVTSGSHGYAESNGGVTVEFGDPKLSDLQSAVFTSCLPGQDVDNDKNIMRSFINAGAWSAVGFKCEVGTNWSDKWTKKFARYAVGDNMEVEAAARKAAVDLGSIDITLASENVENGPVAAQLVVLRQPGRDNIRLGDGPQAPTSAQPNPNTNTTTTAGVSTSLVFDISGTMDNQFNGSQKLEQAKTAGNDVIEVIKQMSRQNAQTGEVAVGSFDGTAYRNQDITVEYDSAKSAIDDLAVGGQTNLAAGIEIGLDQIEASADGTTKVMILLSDGQANVGLTDPDEIISGPVQRAVEDGVKIYVIGFGDPGDLNEDLLRMIASETGGDYVLADSTAVANSISNLFIKYQVAASNTILAEYSGTVTQGGLSKAGQFMVPTNGNLTTVLNWPGSELELRFTDPKGTEVASGYPGLTVSPGRPLVAFIGDAQPGTWTVSVYGKQTSMAQEPYYALVAMKETSATAPPSGGGTSGGGAEILLLLVGLVLAGAISLVAARRRPSAQYVASNAAALTEAASTWALVDSCGKSYLLKTGSNLVGRATSNDVVIADASVSRSHARIISDGGRLSICDLESSLGTYVNGVSLTEGTAVPGDEIRLGRVELRVTSCR